MIQGILIAVLFAVAFAINGIATAAALDPEGRAAAIVAPLKLAATGLTFFAAGWLLYLVWGAP